MTTEGLALIPGPQGCFSEVTPGRNLRVWGVLAWPASHCEGDRVWYLLGACWGWRSFEEFSAGDGEPAGPMPLHKQQNDASRFLFLPIFFFFWNFATKFYDIINRGCTFQASTILKVIKIKSRSSGNVTPIS